LTTIRKATLFDLPTLWHLWVKLTSEECANEAILGREMYPSVALADRDAWALDTAIMIGNPQVLLLIAEKAGEPSGFMLSSVNTRSVGHPKQFALVHQLYVRPADRRAALGDTAMLLQGETERWVRSHGISAVECDCVLSNQARWEKQGFSPAAVRMYKTLEEVK